MDMDWKQIRQWVTVAACGILLYWGLQHIDQIGGVAGSFIDMVMPFLMGAAIAFILRRPLYHVEKVFQKIGEKKGLGIFRKASRGLGIVCTFLLFIAVLLLVVLLVVPEFVNAIGILFTSLEQFGKQAVAWLEEQGALTQEMETWINSLQIDWVKIGNSVKDWLISGASTVVGSTVGAVGAVVSGVTDMVMSVIFCIYVLAQKEKLGKQAEKLTYAILPEKKAAGLIRVVKMAGDTFSSFFTSQILEAIILGSMFFVSMSLLQFPYALVISVLIAVMALIPIFGAFIGCAIGAFLILMVDPIKALWFVALFILLQQIEGNLIYPRVVGGSIGLPSIWVLVAVSVGGSMMGVLGMLLFIPLFSVFYNLLREWTNHRLTQKKASPASENRRPEQQSIEKTTNAPVQTPVRTTPSTPKKRKKK